jgi:type IV pilus assembly protein PilM
MLQDLPSPETYDPDDPPESIVLVSLGTDATDLVVTNGFKVWQRSVPLGGSHFTKALTKEMKLTFAKAEHLKRNATTAQDPKAVFQAMRPVFNDLQTELQRSLGFFTNLDRTAKIGRVVAMGNAFKLPGLRRYLAQSLGFEIERVEAFRGLVGPEVLATPAFKDNVLSFGVCYGLCLQALGGAGLRTNLLPKEITMDRLIRRKKPWAVAAAAIVMLACTITYTAHSLHSATVRQSDWKTPEAAADSAVKKSGDLIKEEGDAKTKFDDIKKKGDHLINNLGGRKRWMEFLAAIDACLPEDKTEPPKTTDPEKLRDAIMHRNQLLVTNIDSQQIDDVGKWFAAVKNQYTKIDGVPDAPPASNPPSTPAAGGDAAAATGNGPSGPGWIVQIYGRHYHNADNEDEGVPYVQKTLLKALSSEKMREMGVSYPVLINPEAIVQEEIPIPNPKRQESDAAAAQSAGGMGMIGDAAPTADKEKHVQVKRFGFRVQFIWQPKSATEEKAPPPVVASGAPAGSAAPATAAAAGPTVKPTTPAPIPAAAGPSAAPSTVVPPATGAPPAHGPGPAPGPTTSPAATPAAGVTPPKP